MSDDVAFDRCTDRQLALDDVINVNVQIGRSDSVELRESEPAAGQ